MKNHGEQGKQILLCAVQGQPSAAVFLHYMKHLKTGILSKTRETLIQISPYDTDSFVDLLSRRLRKFFKLIQFKCNGTIHEPCIENVQWSEKYIHCIYNGNETDDPTVIANVLHNTRRYALIFYLVMLKLEEKVRYSAPLVMGDSSNMTATLPTVPIQKFRTNFTVAMLGAFMRVEVDKDIIHEPNVSELCRRAANDYSTNQRENVSAHSLRNAFDNPLPETLDKLAEEFKRLARYAEKLRDSQRR